MLELAQRSFAFLADHPLVVVGWAVCLVGLVIYAMRKGRHG